MTLLLHSQRDIVRFSSVSIHRVRHSCRCSVLCVVVVVFVPAHTHTYARNLCNRGAHWRQWWLHNHLLLLSFEHSGRYANDPSFDWQLYWWMRIRSAHRRIIMSYYFNFNWILRRLKKNLFQYWVCTWVMAVDRFQPCHVSACSHTPRVRCHCVRLIGRAFRLNFYSTDDSNLFSSLWACTPTPKRITGYVCGYRQTQTDAVQLVSNFENRHVYQFGSESKCSAFNRLSSQPTERWMCRLREFMGIASVSVNRKSRCPENSCTHHITGCRPSAHHPIRRYRCLFTHRCIEIKTNHLNEPRTVWLLGETTVWVRENSRRN